MQVQCPTRRCRGALFLIALALLKLSELPATTFLASRGSSAATSTSVSLARASAHLSAASPAHHSGSLAGVPFLLGAAGAASFAFVRRQGSRVAVKAVNEDQTNKPFIGGDPEDVIPFEIRGFPLSNAILYLGIGLTLFSFYDYGVNVSNSFSGITFIYAIPCFLLGAALVYAQLEPVECETDSDAKGLFDQLATKTLKKIKNDVTRHRYGDDAHLDTSLKALGLTVPQGKYPKLIKLLESKSSDGQLEFTMLFESKDVPYTMWSADSKLVTYDRFFGPGVWSTVSKYSSEKKIAALKLTTGARPAAAVVPKKEDEQEEKKDTAMASA